MDVTDGSGALRFTRRGRWLAVCMSLHRDLTLASAGCGQLWNAAANDEIRLSPKQPRHAAMGLHNSGWLWNYGSHEVTGAVDTVEGRTHKASFD